MTFCPLGNTNSDSPLSDSALSDFARVQGQNLALCFDRIRGQTADWRNEPLAEALVDAALTKTMHVLASSGRWGKENQTASNAFWEPVEPFLRLGWLQLRARTKPLGYAGDYELLEAICENRCADDPLGRIFDRYFLAQAAPMAVAARTQQSMIAMVSHIYSRPPGEYRYVGFQPGPALDLRRACAMLDSERRAGIHATLLDLDPAAVDHAAEHLRNWLPEDALSRPRENLFRMATRGLGQRLGTPDFLVCPGLFDYFDDEAAVANLRMFWEQLADGGLMLVGNFAPHNPTRAYMEWVANWYLNYRTPQKMEELALTAGISRTAFDVGSDRVGVNLFLVAQKV